LPACLPLLWRFGVCLPTPHSSHNFQKGHIV
jgi:hypothetical protein